jgi:hypothetical protein
MAVDAAATIAALHVVERDIIAAARQAFGQSIAFAAELARTTTAFKDGPNASLRGSIRRVMRNDWSGFVIAGGRGARHALFVEDGTKAHEIRPKRVGSVSSRRRAGKAMPPLLRFQINGRWVSAKVVHHPGTKPTHFMLDARNQAETALFRFVEAGVSSAIGA